MREVNDAISQLREALETYSNDDISDLTDAQLVGYATAFIADLELENGLYQMAVENNITASEFERWLPLANAKINQLAEGEELDDGDLLALLREIRN